MKKLILTGIISLIIGISGGWLLFHNHSSSSSSGTKSERKILYYRSPMNPTVTSKVPMKDAMGMDYVPVYADQSSSDSVGPNQIHIDPATQQNIGVTTETVEKRKLSRNIRTTANINYDETKLYTITTKIMGYVEKLFVDYTGQLVRKGQPLLEVYSPDLVSTQEEYLQAIKYRNNISKNGSLISQKGADQLVESAKRRLLYWDISEKEIQALEKRGTPQKTMTIYSPANGIVTDKMVINGQNIEPGMVLYKIADLTTVWGIAQIYQYELPWIKLGDKVDLKLSYMPGKTFQGRISYIYPYLDTDSKTVQVRIEIRNTSDYEFKPGMFADANVKSPVTLETVVVPNQAIIHTGTRDIAIIALGNGYFEPRTVVLGVRGDSGYVQILKGITAGEKIVTSSQFLIDSESNLNAALNNMKEPVAAENPDSSTQNNATEKPKSKKEAMNNMVMKGNHSTPVEYKGVIDVKSIDDNKDGKIYQCPMDFNVLSDKPGVDPKCGMKLQEVSLKTAKENLIKSGFKAK